MVKVLWVELPNKMYDEYRLAITKVKGGIKKGDLKIVTMNIIQEFIEKNRGVTK